MPWIDVTEPFATPARLKPPRPASTWAGALAVDRGWAELSDVAATGHELDLSDCSTLSIADSVLDHAGLSASGDLEIEIRQATLGTCDFGQSRVSSIRNARIVGSKLVGTDLSGATLSDVVFEGCTFRYANLRMAKLTRVQFIDCALDEVDCYELTANDVDFTGTKLSEVNVDQMQASHVDLRGATELLLTGVNNLSGCLVAEHQLVELVYSLAQAAGIGIEREPEL